MSKTPYIDLDARARTIFREIVENFMLYGDPVGSRTLERGGIGVSAATIRNVMADLEEMGLLFSPHTSAGRLPTDLGLRFFIDGILEVSNLPEDQRVAMEDQIAQDSTVETLLDTVSETLSGLTSCAGLVVTSKRDKSIKQIEFVQIDSMQGLAVIVYVDGDVENRLFALPPGMTSEDLKRAGNYLTGHLSGQTIAAMRNIILEDIKKRESELGLQTAKIVEAGLATQTPDGKLIVRGLGNLLDASAIADLDAVREMMSQLEDKTFISNLLEQTGKADGVKIFIGSENQILKTKDHSMILAPYTNGTDQQIVGTIGVIGPTRLNYAQIIPSINVLADILSRRLQLLDRQTFAPSSE